MGDPGITLDKLTILSKPRDESEYLSPSSSRRSSSSDASRVVIPEPPAEEIAAIITTLTSTLKVISAPVCPTHPDLYYCSCADALAALPVPFQTTLKRNTFCRLFDAEILRFKPHAFDYDGSQSAHHLFVYRSKITPKHWLRDWLQTSIAATLFGPSGKLKDTITALLEYWAIRTVQWRARYGTLHVTTQSDWFETEYGIVQPTVKEKAFSLKHDLPRGTLLEGDECLVLKKTFQLTSGGLAMAYSSTSASSSPSSLPTSTSATKNSGSDGTKNTTAAVHETRIELSPMTLLAKGFGVRYHVWEACHPDCDVMTARRQQWVANWLAADLARRLGYGDCWAGKGTAQEIVGGSWAKIRL